MLHVLKTVQPFFGLLWTGEKNFEVRKLDRNFKVGDRLVLREWFPDLEEFGVRKVVADIAYILTSDDFPDGIMPGYGVLGLVNIEAKFYRGFGDMVWVAVCGIE